MEKKQIVGFFDEAINERSSTRMNTFIIMCVWILVVFFQLLVQGNFSQFEFHILILTAAFAPKSIAKFAEMKTSNSVEPTKEIEK